MTNVQKILQEGLDYHDSFSDSSLHQADLAYIIIKRLENEIIRITKEPVAQYSLHKK